MARGRPEELDGYRRDISVNRLDARAKALAPRETPDTSTYNDEAKKARLIAHHVLFSQERTMPHREKGRIVETATEARGAERGPTVRNVLLAGTGLVVVGFVIVYLYYFAA
jgi:hypothetical protein